MDPHKVDTERTTGVVVADGGEPQAGAFFLRPKGAGWESMGHRLEDPETKFIPVEFDGLMNFVNLNAIDYIEFFDRDQPDARRASDLGAIEIAAHLTMRTGEEMEGTLIHMVAPGRERLSDVLNDEGRFFIVMMGESVRFVRRARVARVRFPLEEL